MSFTFGERVRLDGTNTDATVVEDRGDIVVVLIDGHGAPTPMAASSVRKMVT